MVGPFDIFVARPSQNEGTIAETIAKSFAQGCELRSFFLLGGCGPHNQRQIDGFRERMDLGNGYLAAEFDNMF